MTGRGALDAVGAGLVAVAIWSVAGILVALRLDNLDAAWKFLFALGGSGVTLIAIGMFETRLDG